MNNKEAPDAGAGPSAPTSTEETASTATLPTVVVSAPLLSSLSTLTVQQLATAVVDMIQSRSTSTSNPL